MEVSVINTEQKISINLSSYAESILHQDIESFAPDQTFTGFLNDIISRYAEYADASISTALEAQRRQLRLALEQDPHLTDELNDFQQEQVTHLLDKDTESALLAKSRTYESGRVFTFRLNNENYKRFIQDQETSWRYPDVEYYSGHYSRYFKAIIEEYCRNSLYQREEIYFRHYIDTIQQAAETGKLLRAEIVNHSDVNCIQTWDIRPFKLLPDISYLYHYLIGKTVPAGGLRRDEILASFRLSRIRKLDILNHKTARSGMLSSVEKKEIQDKISKRSVSFLIGEECDIQVRLTENGKQLYKIILFMRPPLTRIDSDGYYHFLCTKVQAQRYFIRFGPEAEIIGPEDLRQTFADLYIAAAELYHK